MMKSRVFLEKGIQRRGTNRFGLRRICYGRIILKEGGSSVMNGVVAVEDGLSNVREALEREGYRVVGMKDFKRADAIVISGMDEDMSGVETVQVDAPVINAEGRQTEEIVGEVGRHIRLKYE